jgi:hypothetical protein
VPQFITAGDFNEDGYLDLALPMRHSDRVSVLLWMPAEGRFEQSATMYPIDGFCGDYPTRIATGDFDEDNHLDLAVTNQVSATIAVLRGNGDGSFDVSFTSPTGGGDPRSIVSGDFDEDGHIDLVVVHINDNTMSLLRGVGDGTLQSPETSPLVGANFPVDLTTSDFNGDTHLDLAIVAIRTNNLLVFLGQGNGTFVNVGDYPVGTAEVTAADLDDDGNADLVVGNYDNGYVSVLLGDGNGGFSSAVNYPAGAGAYGITTGNVDGDAQGTIDIAVACALTDNVCILSGYGDGSFAAPDQYYIGGDPQGIVAGDFDGSGFLDLAVPKEHGNDDVAILMSALTVPVVEVAIDIKPGSYPNSINLGSQGVVPVAILSCADFDATQVDPDTVTLAGSSVAIRGKGNKLLAHEEDVNEDGLVDLVLQVETENLEPDQLQDGYGYLEGQTYDGLMIEGCDEVTVVPLE